MSKIRESARGQMCLTRLPGICCHDPETTVLAHANGAGWAIKQPDSEASYACRDCHDVIDGKISSKQRRALEEAYGENWRLHLRIDILEAQKRTRLKLIADGLIILQ